MGPARHLCGDVRCATVRAQPEQQLQYCGHPTGSGGYLFTLLVTDGSGGSATQRFALQIAAAIPTVMPTLSRLWLALLGLILILAAIVSFSRKRNLSFGWQLRITKVDFLHFEHQVPIKRTQ